MNKLTQKEVQEQLYYEISTGCFYRKRNDIIDYKKQAGYLHRGYRVIRIKSRQYFAHRLAWLYVYGEFPQHLLDHINGDTKDNSITNLRCVDYRGNASNKKRHRDGSPVGVYWAKRDKKWKTEMYMDGKHYTLYMGDNAEIGASIRMEAVEMYYAGIPPEEIRQKFRPSVVRTDHPFIQYDTVTGKWETKLYTGKKHIYIGSYSTLETARSMQKHAKALHNIGAPLDSLTFFLNDPMQYIRTRRGKRAISYSFVYKKERIYSSRSLFNVWLCRGLYLCEIYKIPIDIYKTICVYINENVVYDAPYIDLELPIGVDLANLSEKEVMAIKREILGGK